MSARQMDIWQARSHGRLRDPGQGGENGSWKPSRFGTRPEDVAEGQGRLHAKEVLSTAYPNRPMLLQRLPGTNKESHCHTHRQYYFTLSHQICRNAPHSLPLRRALSTPRPTVFLSSENLSHRSRSSWLHSGTRVFPLCLPHCSVTAASGLIWGHQQ